MLSLYVVNSFRFGIVKLIIHREHIKCLGLYIGFATIKLKFMWYLK